MLRNPAGWLAVGVLAVATIVMVFFIMPQISADRQATTAAVDETGASGKTTAADKAAAPPVGSAKTEDHAPEQQATSSAAIAPTGDRPVANQPASAASSAATSAPTFDILRVEPDGSTVIAGRAEPGTTLEVAASNSVLAKADVAPGGEFAAILDKPLPPGDHQLVLKATARDGRTVMSQEVATVSVPKSKGGELLAMVTKPGEASRLIATPSTGEPTIASQSALPSQPESREQATKTERVALPAVVDKATPAAERDASQTALAAPDSVLPKQTGAGSKSDIQITAVEIEGDRLFVAGTAQPRARLRGYADDARIGEAEAAVNGHFVIEGRLPLSVGDHRIAVDQIGADGKAVLRVAVPFSRPAGDQVAAVAGPAVQANVTALSPIDGGAFDRLRNQVARAQEILNGLYAGGAVPGGEQLAAARSATAIALRSLAEYRLPAGAAEAARRIAGTTIEQALAALSALEALPRDAVDFGKGLAGVNTLIASAIGPVVDTPPRQQAGAEVAAAEAPTPAQVPPANGTPTIEQAPLTQSDNASVIIRRGDTLWQISRRVYGQGVRYTTIYLANEEKIANPDRIQPGQIFGVPDEARPDAEELHRKRLQQGRS